MADHFLFLFMTRIYLNNKEELTNHYPNHSFYLIDKRIIYNENIYKKEGRYEFIHNETSWKIKHLILGMMAGSLSFFIIPVFFQSYHRLVKKLFHKASTGVEKFSLYVKQNSVLESEDKIQHSHLSDKNRKISRIKYLEKEILEFDRDTNLLNAFKEVEDFFAAHKNDLSVDLASLEIPQLNELLEQINSSKKELEEKSRNALLGFPKVAHLIVKYPNIMLKPNEHKITPETSTIIEQLTTRYYKYHRLCSQSQSMLDAYTSFTHEITKNILVKSNK